MSETRKVVDFSLIGKRGYPRYPSAIGMAPPMKDEPIPEPDVPLDSDAHFDPVVDETQR